VQRESPHPDNEIPLRYWSKFIPGYAGAYSVFSGCLGSIPLANIQRGLEPTVPSFSFSARKLTVFFGSTAVRMHKNYETLPPVFKASAVSSRPWACRPEKLSCTSCSGRLLRRTSQTKSLVQSKFQRRAHSEDGEDAKTSTCVLVSDFNLHPMMLCLGTNSRLTYLKIVQEMYSSSQAWQPPQQY
jgi:hypothetical protein